MPLMQMRNNVFETNSSSTHSITMVDGATYADWKAGKVLFCDYPGKDEPNFKPVDEVPEADRDDWVTHDEYFESDYLEGFEDSYTTKAGEEVIAFGKYGHDG